MTASPRRDSSRRRLAGHCLPPLLLAAALCGGTPSDAASREKSRPAAAPEVSPRGQRTANDIKFGEWQKLCFKPGGAKTLCRTSITGTYETGQMAVRADLIERDGEPTPRLQVFVPVGMYLRIPVKLSIDGGRPYRLPYNWCLTNACIAADVAAPHLIKEMEAGKSLALEVVDSNLLALTTSLPLAQFASVHRGAPARTLEQDIDE